MILILYFAQAISTAINPIGVFVNTKSDGYIFTTTVTLTTTSSYTSSIFSVDGYTQLQQEVLADQIGTITVTWYSDSLGSDLIQTKTFLYDTANSYEYTSGPLYSKYVKFVFTNTSVTNQTNFYFAVKLLTKGISGDVLGITDNVPASSVANLGRNVIIGQTDGLFFKNVPITEQGHLEVAVHGPINPFGSIHTEPCTPILQLDAIYGIDPLTATVYTGGSGTVTSVFSMFSTNAVNGSSFATLQSAGRINYRPGQGIIGLFTAIFPTLSVPVTDCTRIIGLGQPEDGVYYGYYPGYSSFGIIYQNRGFRKVVTITVTAAATGSGNLTITLNSIAFSVPVTNAGASIPFTVREIAQFAYTGWSAQANSSSTIIFISNDALTSYNSGTYSITVAAGVAGSIASTRNSIDPTTQFIQQANWNSDNLSGTGGISNPSGVLADWTKGNVFKIGIQYLGFGAITFEIEVNSTTNNTTFIVVHTMRLPNTLTKTSFGNPSFSFIQSSRTITSTDAIINSGSFGGFIEGSINTINNRFTYSGTFSNLPTTLTPLYTIQNKLYFNGVANQSTISLISIGASSADTGANAVASIVYLIKNALLGGSPSFSSYSTSSVSNFNNSTTTIGALSTFNNSQIIFSLPLSYSSSQTFSFNDFISLQPGDTLTVCALTVSGTANSVSVSINTRENK